MSFKQQLLDSLDETQALYHMINTHNQEGKIADLHQLRHMAFVGNYQDYMNQARYEPALTFVLTDVYSSMQHEQRDAKVAKAFSSMSRVLPDTILETIAKAVAFNCNMLRLDTELIKSSQLLQKKELVYQDLLTTDELKARHQDLVYDFIELAHTIHHFVKKPFMQMTLKASRIPAKAADLMELQEFLENCFMVFKTMRSPDAFLRDYKLREVTWA